jgi:hypothetical protein
MGFLSGLFGGGGGSTTTSTSTTVNVTPQTEVNIPVDELADAINQSAVYQGNITKAVAQVETAFKKAELQQQQEFKQVELEQSEKIRKSLFFLGALGLVTYLIKNGKR